MGLVMSFLTKALIAAHTARIAPRIQRIRLDIAQSVSSPPSPIGGVVVVVGVVGLVVPEVGGEVSGEVGGTVGGSVTGEVGGTVGGSVTGEVGGTVGTVGIVVTGEVGGIVVGTMVGPPVFVVVGVFSFQLAVTLTLFDGIEKVVELLLGLAKVTPPSFTVQPPKVYPVLVPASMVTVSL